MRRRGYMLKYDSDVWRMYERLRLYVRFFVEVLRLPFVVDVRFFFLKVPSAFRLGFVPFRPFFGPGFRLHAPSTVLPYRHVLPAIFYYHIQTHFTTT